MRTVLDRRRVLRGLLGTGGAVAIPLPALHIMLNGNGTALAATGDPLPVRYVLWFFGNGVLPATWYPKATGANWELTPQMAPLANVKDSLTVVSGLTTLDWISNTGHPNGAAACVTGADSVGGFPGSPSLDQMVADKIGVSTPYRSIEIGVSSGDPGGTGSVSQLSARANRTFLYPEFNAQVVYKRLIGVAPTNPVDMKALAQTRGSAFDAVMEDARQLRVQLGMEDRLRLDGHLEGLRTLANRVAALGTGTTTATPKKLAVPTVGRDMKAEAPPAINSAMADLAMFALSTGQTNVLSFIFTLPAAHVFFRNLGPDMDVDFHDTCHGDPGTEGNQPRVQKAVVYTMQCLAEFLEKMRATPDGADTLLDHALVHVTSEVSPTSAVQPPGKNLSIFSGR